MFGDATTLPFPDDSFDLVLAIEVLEHVPGPDAALGELARVCSGTFIASVPFEPIWRAGNLARRRYVRQLGNTPGHVNHWTRWGFQQVRRDPVPRPAGPQPPPLDDGPRHPRLTSSFSSLSATSAVVSTTRGRKRARASHFRLRRSTQGAAWEPPTTADVMTLASARSTAQSASSSSPHRCVSPVARQPRAARRARAPAAPGVYVDDRQSADTWHRAPHGRAARPRRALVGEPRGGRRGCTGSIERSTSRRVHRRAAGVADAACRSRCTRPRRCHGIDRVTVDGFRSALGDPHDHRSGAGAGARRSAGSGDRQRRAPGPLGDRLALPRPARPSSAAAADGVRRRWIALARRLRWALDARAPLPRARAAKPGCPGRSTQVVHRPARRTVRPRRLPVRRRSASSIEVTGAARPQLAGGAGSRRPTAQRAAGSSAAGVFEYTWEDVTRRRRPRGADADRPPPRGRLASLTAWSAPSAEVSRILRTQRRSDGRRRGRGGRRVTTSAMSRARISAPFSLRWKPSSARTSLPWPSRGSMTYSAQPPLRLENRAHVSTNCTSGRVAKAARTASSWTSRRAVTSGLSSLGIPTQITVRPSAARRSITSPARRVYSGSHSSSVRDRVAVEERAVGVATAPGRRCRRT